MLASTGLPASWATERDHAGEQLHVVSVELELRHDLIPSPPATCSQSGPSPLGTFNSNPKNGQQLRSRETQRAAFTSLLAGSRKT